MKNLTTVALDVRPILARGEEPFQHILSVVDALEPGQSLRLIAPLYPVPLIHLLAQRGYAHAVRELGGGDWEVVFSPAVGGPASDRT